MLSGQLYEEALLQITDFGLHLNDVTTWNK